MGRRVIILPFLLLLTSCYDSFEALVPSDSAQLPSVNYTIEELHSLYALGTRTISQDLVIEGVVTANDEYGNFYNSFIIQNDNFALEVLDGTYYNFALYPIGGKVIISLQGLGIDRYMGILRTGIVTSNTSSYALDYMDNKAVADLYITLSNIVDRPSPRITKISELTQAQAGEFITIKSLELHTEDGVERSWAEYALFRDSNLDTLWCYTSPYADFASSIIPNNTTVSLSGILEYGTTDTLEDQFIIKLHAQEDCTW